MTCTLCGSPDHNRSACPMADGLTTRRLLTSVGVIPHARRRSLLSCVADAWRAWRRRRYWTQARQVEHLRTMLLGDHRWLSADQTADALTERYLAALAPDWYTRSHEDTARLRSRLGLVPPRGYDPGPGPEPTPINPPKPRGV